MALRKRHPGRFLREGVFLECDEGIRVGDQGFGAGEFLAGGEVIEVQPSLGTLPLGELGDGKPQQAGRDIVLFGRIWRNSVSASTQLWAASRPLAFSMARISRAGRDDGFQEGAQALLGLHPDELFARGGIGEGDDGGDGAHVEARRQVGVGVHIHLGQAEAAAQSRPPVFQAGG